MFCSKSSIYSFIFIWAVLPPGGLASASESPTEWFTIDEAIEIALQRNHELQAVAVNIDRAKARLEWAGRLENPVVNVSTSDDFAGLDENEGALTVGITQQFPITKRLSEERRVRASQIQLAEAELAEAKRDLAFEIERIAIDQIHAQLQARKVDELKDVADELVASLERQMTVGEASALDVSQAVLHREGLERRLAEFEATIDRLGLDLQHEAAYERPVDMRIHPDLPIPTEPPQTPTLSDVLEKRPDYQLALDAIQVAQASLSLEESRRWSDIAFKVFGTRGRATDEPLGLERNTLIGVSVSIPIPLRQRNREAIQVAKINRSAAETFAHTREIDIDIELRQAQRDAAAHARIAQRANGPAVENARERFDLVRQAFGEGLASVVELNQAQEQLLEFEIEAIEALTHFHQTNASLRYVSADYPYLDTPEIPNPHQEAHQ